MSVEKMLFELGWSGVPPLTTLAEICLAYIRAGGDTAAVVRRIDGVIGEDGDGTGDCIRAIGIFLDEAQRSGCAESLCRPGTRDALEVLDALGRLRGAGSE